MNADVINGLPVTPTVTVIDLTVQDILSAKVRELFKASYNTSIPLFKDTERISMSFLNSFG
jgi:hypothetical protein